LRRVMYDLAGSMRKAMREISLVLNFRTIVLLARVVLSSNALTIAKNWGTLTWICSAGPDLTTSQRTCSRPMDYSRSSSEIAI
jgi:hypothetical protein